eukprot:8482780-Prorocentrum_lima.AAC.1
MATSATRRQHGEHNHRKYRSESGKWALARSAKGALIGSALDWRRRSEGLRCGSSLGSRG